MAGVCLHTPAMALHLVFFCLWQKKQLFVNHSLARWIEQPILLKCAGPSGGRSPHGADSSPPCRNFIIALLPLHFVSLSQSAHPAAHQRGACRRHTVFSFQKVTCVLPCKLTRNGETVFF